MHHENPLLKANSSFAGLKSSSPSTPKKIRRRHNLSHSCILQRCILVHRLSAASHSGRADREAASCRHKAGTHSSLGSFSMRRMLTQHQPSQPDMFTAIVLQELLSSEHSTVLRHHGHVQPPSIHPLFRCAVTTSSTLLSHQPSLIHHHRSPEPTARKATELLTPK